MKCLLAALVAWIGVGIVGCQGQTQSQDQPAAPLSRRRSG